MPTKIVKSNAPKESKIESIIHRIDYVDSYCTSLTSTERIEPFDLVKAFFNGAPKWVIGIFKLRDQMVKPLKLKRTDFKGLLKQLENADPKIGQKIGNELVIASTSVQEMILKGKDQHLNLALSFFVTKKVNKHTITLTTAVKFNNKIGRVYLFIIKPFHKLLVKVMLKNILKSLNTI